MKTKHHDNKPITKPFLASLSLLIFLQLVFLIWAWQAGGNEMAKFENASISLRNEIKSKIYNFEQAISSVRQLASPEGISQSDWDNYYEVIDLDRYEGLSAVTFSKYVTRDEKNDYERSYHQIFPETDKTEYLPITFITPLSDNESYLGFDTGSSNPESYYWVRLARDSGLIQRSDAYEFSANPNAEPLEIMFITSPVYKPGVSLADSSQRRDNYLGTIIASFNLEDFTSALISDFSNGYEFSDIKIYDSTQEDATLIFELSTGTDTDAYQLTNAFEVDMGNRPLLIITGSDRQVLSWQRILLLQIAILAVSSLPMILMKEEGVAHAKK